jgi:hypothetical protein
MQKSKKIREPIPEEFASIEEAAEFWEKHDLSEYWDETREVEFDIKVPPAPRYIPLEQDTAEVISKIARKKHISPETLVNLWLKERLFKLAKNA